MRLLNPSLGRKTLGPLELLELAAPRPQVGPMPGGGVRLGPAVSPPRWSTGGYVDPGTQIMQGLQAGLGMIMCEDGFIREVPITDIIPY